MMTLGEKIWKLRRERGMSQDELAERLDVSRQAISKWERDEAMPETEKIIRIAQTFGVSTDHLLMDQEAAAPQVPPVAPAQGPSTGQQFRQGLRRHGYKSGYVMVACGVVVCILAVAILLLLPGMGAGVFDAADSFTDSASGMVDGMGFGAASGMFDGVFGIFNQQVDQMENAWSNGLRTTALLIAVPMLLLGTGLLIGGVVILVKGKKIAKAET